MTDQTRIAQPLFQLGQVVATRRVVLEVPPARVAVYVTMHSRGDWGCIDVEDRATNDDAVKHGGRILSAYAIDPAKPCKGYGDNTLWIITEADRSTTTLLLPDEY